MLRSVLLGKLSLSILASLAVGAVCVSQPWRGTYTIVQSAQWISVGVFFLLLGIGQLVAVYFLFHKKP